MYRIGILCFPTYGGSGVVATELARSLAERGHEVHVISYAPPVRLQRYSPHIVFHEVPVFEYPLFESPLYTIHAAATIANLVQYADLQVVHAHYALPHGISAFLARASLDAPRFAIVTTLHGTDVTLVGQHPSFFPITRLALLQSDRLSCVSRFLEGVVRDRFRVSPERVTVIPNFVDTSVLVPKPLEERRRQWRTDKCIVHVSNFRPVKRVLDVLRVFERVRTRVPCELVLIGDGPDRILAEQYCVERGLYRSVHFLGKQEDVGPPLQGASVFLLPSELESFGLAALEAMSCGVPVVATAVGGVPEVIEDGVQGFLHAVGDIEGMAAHVEQLLTDEDLWVRMSEAARRRALDFDRERVVPQYEILYDTVMKGRSDEVTE
jgi:N-acetyl-alpha-D-glucosaminyl L-malate synthase BshA